MRIVESVETAPAMICMKERRRGGGGRRGLVEKTLAADGSTKAGDTIRCIDFAFELVVVREFLVCQVLAYVILITELGDLL